MPEMPLIPALFPSILTTSLSPPPLSSSALSGSSPSGPLILKLDISLSDILFFCLVLSLCVIAVCSVIYALFYRPRPAPVPKTAQDLTPVPESGPEFAPESGPEFAPESAPEFAPEPPAEERPDNLSDEPIWTTEQIAAHITRKISDCEARITHMEKRMGNRNVAIAEQFNSLSDALTSHVLKVARAHIDTRVEEMMQILLDAQNDSTEDVVNTRLDAYLRSFDDRLNRFMRQVVELLVDCARAVLPDGTTASDAALERLLTGVYTEPQTTPTPKPTSAPKSSKSEPFADADFGDNVEDEEAKPPRKSAEVISLREGTDLTSDWAMELLRQRLNQEIAKEKAELARKKAEEADKEDPDDPDDPPKDPFDPVA